ncbi:DNA topoisomerase III [Arsukibacterium sp.]|uniref:DNA topoisomerase III n=1 Tax=Arsukibacterium sp. TaxID=1977258 RepID=UPI002FDAB35E
MILYIAEKPSLGRAIAAVLPKPQHKEPGCIRLANGDVVSWCIGHLLEQASPEDYQPEFKRWQAAHLPIIPQRWQLKARSSSQQQLTILKKLIKQADQIIHAGDPDREGQLLVDEVLAWSGVSACRIANTQRLLINDLNPSAVKKALAQLKPNRDFVPLSTSALARSRADWLYGLNMTRAYTLQGQKAGYQGVLSVGRVQTPLLGLVVRRDAEITQFTATDFFQVKASVKTAENGIFSAWWQPSVACEPYQDSEGRIIHRALAEKVSEKIRGHSAIVTKLTQNERQQAAPLPYSLSALQIDAAKLYKLSAQQVLDSCQQLYERHKLITYPRSDSRYLPNEQWAAAAKVTKAMANNCAVLQPQVAAADLTLRSKAWNDKLVEAHHAIIPTEKNLPLERLSHTEQQLYTLIAKQYLAQFYPLHRYQQTRVELDIQGGLFISKARIEREAGWKSLFSKTKQPQAETTQEMETEENLSALPLLTQGQILHCTDAAVIARQTEPPAPFNDASLLAAMTGISRYVKDPDIKKILKDTDGLGTEATRAGIIELLFKRGFLCRQGNAIHATSTGKALIAALPDSATLPDMTAQWEASLNAICQRQKSYQAFMQPLTENLQLLIEQAFCHLPSGLPQQTKRWPNAKYSAGKGGASLRGAKNNRKKKTTSSRQTRQNSN